MGISCPKCGTPLPAVGKRAGERVRCPNPACRCTFRISRGAGKPLGPPGAASPPPVPNRPTDAESPRPPEVTPPPIPARTEDGQRKGILKRCLGAIKHHLGTLMLAHQVSKLRAARDRQYAALGGLADQCRPSGLDVAGDLETLSQVRLELGQKESARAVLKSTPGSAAALRELKQEERQLKERQRSLLIAIGQKAFRARPEMGGAAAYYSGLQQIERVLRDKQDELQKRSGVRKAAPFPLQSLIKPLAVVCVVLSVLVLLCLALPRFFEASSGVPSWGEYCVSDETAGMVFVDVVKLLDTKPFHAFMESLPPEESRLPGGLEVEDLGMLFLTYGDGGTLVAARTQEDLPLEDFASSESKPAEFRKVEYVGMESGPFPDGLLAKTAEGTFCLADSEDHLRDALTRLDRGRELTLEGDLAVAVERASREEHFVAGLFDTPPATLPNVDAFGIGVSIDASSVELSGALVFRTIRNAAQFVEEHQDVIDAMEDDLRQRAEGKLSDETLRTAEDGLELLRELQLRQRDKIVQLRGTWPVADVAEVVPVIRQVAELF